VAKALHDETNLEQRYSHRTTLLFAVNNNIVKLKKKYEEKL
jgi:hypothetical protein